MLAERGLVRMDTGGAGVGLAVRQKRRQRVGGRPHLSWPALRRPSRTLPPIRGGIRPLRVPSDDPLQAGLPLNRGGYVVMRFEVDQTMRGVTTGERRPCPSLVRTDAPFKVACHASVQCAFGSVGHDVYPPDAHGRHRTSQWWTKRSHCVKRGRAHGRGAGAVVDGRARPGYDVSSGRQATGLSPDIGRHLPTRRKRNACPHDPRGVDRGAVKPLFPRR